MQGLRWAIVRSWMPIQVRAARLDVMAGGGGAVGPAQVISHQEPGKLAGTLTQGRWTQFFFEVSYPEFGCAPQQCSGQACEKYAEDHGFQPG
jgi:hypothetical protein